MTPLESARAKWAARGKRGPVELTEPETRAVIADAVARTPWTVAEARTWTRAHQRRREAHPPQ